VVWSEAWTGLDLYSEAHGYAFPIPERP
jgi:hypothetical protein